MGSTKITILSVLLLVSSCCIQMRSTNAESSTCSSHTFRNSEQFSSCNDLPVLNSQLFWTYDSSARTARIAFRAAGVSSSNWVAWALNPSGSGMIGAQALVAVQNSSGVHAFTSSVDGYNIPTLTPASLSFRVDNLTATKENNEMIIFATITPPSTTVNQVWQVGPMSNGQPAAHSVFSTNIRSTGSINFLSETEASMDDDSTRIYF